MVSQCVDIREVDDSPPNTNNVALLNTGIDDGVVGSGENIRQVYQSEVKEETGAITHTKLAHLE